MVWAQIAEGVTLEEAIKAEGEKGTATLVAQTEAAPGETTSVAVEKEVGARPVRDALSDRGQGQALTTSSDSSRSSTSSS